MASENLKYGQTSSVWFQILNALGYKAQGPEQSRRIAEKSGVPQNNTSADAPQTGKGEFLFDTENAGVYICTAYTDENTFTWTKIN